MDTNRIHTVYHATRPERDPQALGEAIALEQSVEVIEELISPAIRQALVGRVESVEAVDEDRFRIAISYPGEVAAGQIGALFHMLFGNISFYPRLRLVDLTLPETLLARLQGPRFGLEGVRKAVGIQGRALLCSAIKPRGAPVEQLARLAGDFALGGGDILKDDQNLIHEDFESFKARVDACATAVEEASQKTGRRCLYLPHAAGAGSALQRQLEFIHRRGLPGVLMCPLVLGLETAGRAAADHDLIYMAHPAMAGSFTEPSGHGISAGLLMGSLFRLSGADISVFPARGGRISTPGNDSRETVARLTGPMGDIRPALPCPAGGKTLDMMPDMAREYGPDCAILIGGDLLKARERLARVTADCIETLSGIHAERRCQPEYAPASACEVVSEKSSELLNFLQKMPGYDWEGRDSQTYKDDDTLPFRGVRRVELLGGNGERTHFDLRYFELSPGGYTSLEKHLHTHVIIGARGRGLLRRDDVEQPLEEHDIAYIEPLSIHQLTNPGDEPFGFYCLVDRDRDRPMAP